MKPARAPTASLSTVSDLKSVDPTVWRLSLVVFFLLSMNILMGFLLYKLYQDSETIDTIAAKSNLILDNVLALSTDTLKDYEGQRVSALSAMVNGEHTLAFVRRIADVLEKGGFADLIEKYLQDAEGMEKIAHRLSGLLTTGGD